MMWNITDVRVGYDTENAKLFNLEGCDSPNPIDTLP